MDTIQSRLTALSELTDPLVTLSYAQSLDGCLTTSRGQPTAISGEEALVLTHQLRAAHDAILVGIGTVLSDNPRLTVRHAEGDDPQPIVLDSRLRFPLNARLLTGKPWIVTTAAAPTDKRAALHDEGAHIIVAATDHTNRVDLNAALDAIWERGVTRLMVEGGAHVLTSFLTRDLADQMVVTIAAMMLGDGLHAIGELGGAAPRMHNVITERFGPDIVVWGDLR